MGRHGKWFFIPVMMAMHTLSARSESLTPNEDGQLENAIRQLDVNGPEESEQILRRVLRADPQNARAHMYLAVAILQQEQGKKTPLGVRLREVEQECTKALDVDSTLLAARLARAISRAALGEFLGAQADCDLVEKELGGINQDLDTKLILRKLQNQIGSEPKDWSLILHFGTQYDTNVPLIGRNTGLPLALGRREDFSANSGAEFAYQIRPDDRLEVGIGAALAGSWHADLDLFDEQSYRASTYARHRTTDWLELAAGYDYSFGLLGRKDYFSQHQLTSMGTLIEDSWGRTSFYYQFAPRRFFDVPGVVSGPAFDRSGDTHSVGISQSFALARICNDQPVLFEIGYRHDNISTAGTEYDAECEVINAGFEFPIIDRLKGRCGSEWAFENYRRASVLDFQHRHRDDLVQTYSFALTYALNQWVSVEGGIVWTDDDSNILTRSNSAVYSYERAIYTVGLKVEF